MDAPSPTVTLLRLRTHTEGSFCARAMGAIAVVRLLHKRRSDRDTLACTRAPAG